MFIRSIISQNLQQLILKIYFNFFKNLIMATLSTEQAKHLKKMRKLQKLSIGSGNV
jgi:hypothetical protein